MCGLVAVIGKPSNGFTAELNDVFTTLMFLDQLRGEDSTGVFTVTNKGEVFGAKEASDATKFLKSKDYGTILKRAFAEGAALIGHNRKATRGEVNDANAHPFVVDNNIVLVHNGTMYGDHKKLADTEVDSHAIAHVIHESNGDVQAAMDKIDAAYALIWFDFSSGKLNIIRNTMRPLWFMELHNAFVFSSEKAMLDFVITRHNLNPKTAPTELRPNVLQTFTLSGKSWPIWNITHETIERKSHTPVVIGDPNDACGYDPYWEEYCAWRQKQRMESVNDDDGQVEDAGKPKLELVQVETNPVGFPKSFGKSSLGTTIDNEVRIFRETNRAIEYSLFKQIYQQAYQYGNEVLATPFDYAYANGVDTKGGFYMYSSVINDRDMVVRHFWENRHMDEERLIKICADGDYVYKFVIDIVKFISFTGSPHYRNDTLGGMLCIALKPELMFGGGLGDPKHSLEALETKTAQGRTVH